MDAVELIIGRGQVSQLWVRAIVRLNNLYRHPVSDDPWPMIWPGASMGALRFAPVGLALPHGVSRSDLGEHSGYV